MNFCRFLVFKNPFRSSFNADEMQMYDACALREDLVIQEKD